MPQERLPNLDDQLGDKLSDLPNMDDQLGAVPPSGPRGLNLAGSFLGGLGESFLNMLMAPITMARAAPALSRTDPISGGPSPVARSMPLENIVGNLLKAWLQSSAEGFMREGRRAAAAPPGSAEAFTRAAGAVLSPVGGADLAEQLAGAIPRAAKANDWETVFRLLGRTGGDVAQMVPVPATRPVKAAVAPMEGAARLMDRSLNATPIPAVPQGVLAGERAAPGTEVSSFVDTVRSIPPTLGEKTGSAGVQFVERIVESGISSRGHMLRFRGEQQKTLKKAGEALADSITREPAGDSFELGAKVLDDFERAREVVDGRTNVLYDEWRQSYGHLKIDVRGTGAQKTAQRLRKELGQLKRWLQPDDWQRADDILANFADAGKRPRNEMGQLTGQRPYKLTLDELHQVRSIIGRAVGKAEQAGATHFAGGARKQMFASIDQLMESGLRNMDGLPSEEAARAISMYRDASSAKKAAVETFDNAVIERLAKQSPEKIPDLISGMSVENIQRVRGIVSPKTWAKVQKRLLSDILSGAEAGVQGGALRWFYGPQEDLAEGMATSFLDARKLESSLKKMGGLRVEGGTSIVAGDKLSAIFDDTTIKGLAVMLEAGSKLRINNPNALAGLLLNGGIIMPLTGLIGGTGALGSVMRSAQLAVGSNVIARMLTTQSGQRAVEALSRAMRSAKGMTLDNAVYRTAALNFQQEFRRRLEDERKDPLREQPDEAYTDWDKILEGQVPSGR